MIDDSQLSFSLPSVSRKKVTAVFDGGRLSSDSGVMLLALVERRRYAPPLSLPSDAIHRTSGTRLPMCCEPNESGDPWALADVALATDCIMSLLAERCERPLFTIETRLSRDDLKAIGARVMPKALEKSRLNDGRDMDRTCDPYHVKIAPGAESAEIRALLKTRNVVLGTMFRLCQVFDGLARHIPNAPSR